MKKWVARWGVPLCGLGGSYESENERGWAIPAARNGRSTAIGDYVIGCPTRFTSDSELSRHPPGSD